MITAVVVALITAVVGPLMLAWYTTRQLRSRVGTPNGQGTVVQMVERLLAGQVTQDIRIGRLESCMNDLRSKRDDT